MMRPLKIILALLGFVSIKANDGDIDVIVYKPLPWPSTVNRSSTLANSYAPCGFCTHQTKMFAQKVFSGRCKTACALDCCEIYIGGSPCQTTCSSPNIRCDIDTLAPISRCYCIIGPAQNKISVCVKINSPKCQEKCQIINMPCGRNPNEEYVFGPPCQTTCANLNQPCLIKAASRFACRCKPGYARNQFGICIQINSPQCQQVCEINQPPSPSSCAKKPYEIYIQGGSPCQTTCATLNQSCTIETFAPVNACYCINGYARDQNGNCIKINSKQCQILCGLPFDIK